MLHQPHRKIDCVVRVITPENIEFEYMVAGPFQRLPAFLVDIALRVAAFTFLVVLASIIGSPLGGGAGPVIMAVAAISFFALSWLYGTVMETQFNGRTVGKMAFKLRVISADGRPINGSQAALRNLLRLCDLMPPLTLTLLIPDAPPANILPTFLVGLFSMMLTTRMQRVGDLAANTMVVWEGRRGLHTNLQPEDVRAYSLAELIPPTFQVSRTLARAVALYMERRQYFSVQRREELAALLAKPLLEQFGMRADTSSDLFLCAMYVRIYHSQEQRQEKISASRKFQTGLAQRGPSGQRTSTPALSPTSPLNPSHAAPGSPILGSPMPSTSVAASAISSPLQSSASPAIGDGPDRMDSNFVVEAIVLESQNSLGNADVPRSGGS